MDISQLKPSIPVSEVKPLHLKSICSMLSTNHIILGGPFAQSLQVMFESLVPNTFQYTIVPDEGAANVLSINGAVVRRCDWEFPASVPIFKSLESQYPIQHQLPNSQLCKVDGALTCCSVLLQ